MNRITTRPALIALALVFSVGYLLLGTGLLTIGEKTIDQPMPTAEVREGPGTPDASAGATASPEPISTPIPIEQPKVSPQGLALQPMPILILNPPNLVGKGSVSISGQNFPAHEGVVVTIDGQPINLDVDGFSVVTDKNGSFSGLAVDVPAELPRGKHVVRAVSAKTNKAAEAEFQAQPGGAWIEPSVYAAKPGDSVHFRGGGFNANEQVKVYFDRLGRDALATVQADPAGAISADVAVPMVSASDQHAFIFVGGASGFPARTGFTVLGFYPWVVLSTYLTPPERAIGFAGYDFVPGEVISIYLNQPGVNRIGVLRANNKGAFQVNNAFRVPAKLIGQNTLYFVGQESNTTVSAAFEISSFAPVLNLTAYAGQPGAKVAFSGSGFAGNETLHAYLGRDANGQEVSSFQADQNGSFVESGEFTIPVGTPAGNMDITLVGDVSQKPVTITYKVLQLNVWAELSPYSGAPGTDIYVGGHAFSPGERVDIFVGKSTQGRPAMTANADQKGDFTKVGPIVVPADARGTLEITLVGEQSKSQATASFTILEGSGGQGEGAGQGGNRATPEATPGQ